MATISNDGERHKLVPLSGGYTQCANPPSRGAREHEIIFLLAVKTLAVLWRDQEGHSPSSLAVRIVAVLGKE